MAHIGGLCHPDPDTGTMLTMSKLPTPKPHLLDITPYKAGKSRAGEGAKPSRIIKLASNENPLGPSPKALDAYRKIDTLHRYPDGNAADLRKAIARIHGVDASRVVCGAGSDELINLLIHAYAGPGDEVLYSAHGFLMYKIYATAHGATPVTAPETNLTADVGALLASVTERTRIVFLANPNNPTGTYVPEAEVRRLRDALPAHVLLVLDAAYAEYVARKDYDNGTKLVEATENTVMLRTFSKIYGLPALRLGWAYAPKAVVDVLNRIRSPFNVSTAAMAAGVAALEDEDYTAYVADYTRNERARITAELTALGLTITPSEGNFVLVHFTQHGKTAVDANKHLMTDGIIPREMGGYGLPDALRITVGTADENDALIASLGQFIHG